MSVHLSSGQWQIYGINKNRFLQGKCLHRNRDYARYFQSLGKVASNPLAFLYCSAFCVWLALCPCASVSLRRYWLSFPRVRGQTCWKFMGGFCHKSSALLRGCRLHPVRRRMQKKGITTAAVRAGGRRWPSADCVLAAPLWNRTIQANPS